MELLHQIWQVTGVMAPYLLLGFLVAGVLSVWVTRSFVQRHLGGPGLAQVVKASLFGTPLPLCSCGVIPVAASLRQHGAGKGAAISFLTSTPQTGVDSIMVTYGLLGPVFTLFRVVIAFLSGIFSGMMVDLADGREEQPDGPLEEEETAPAGEGKVVRALRWAFLTLPRDIGKALLLGILLSGLISFLLPDDFFASHLGTGLLPILVMMAAGLPFYVCSTGSVPIAYGLMTAGLSPGAALAFLITGPATNAATITTIWKTMGQKSAGVYLLTIAVCAVAAGLVLNTILPPRLLAEQLHHHEEAMAWYHHLSAIILVAVLGFGLKPKKKKSTCCSKKRPAKKSSCCSG